MWSHTKQKLQDATPDVRDKLERQLDFLEDPLTHIVMLAYLDMQRAVRKMTCKSQEDGATLESVADAVRQCAAWLHRYAIQTTKADGQPSDVVCQLGNWAENKMPEGMAANATCLERALRMMHRVTNPDSRLTDSLGRSAPVMLQRTIALKDGSFITMNARWDNGVARTACQEIARMCETGRTHFGIRFPGGDLLESLKSLFSASAEPDKMDPCQKSSHLEHVAAHWGFDATALAEEYKDYSTHLKEARRQGCSGVDLLDHTVTDLRKARQSHNILQLCYLHLGLSLQNATLERDVSYKRANKDRTPGKMSTECLSQRLHIQLSGQRPQALKQKTSEAEEFNPLIWGAAWDVTPTCRRPPDKRQLSLAGLLGATGGEQPRKVRKEELAEPISLALE